MPPTIGNASNASQINSQLYRIYQPPNGSPYNSHGSNATDVNPVHIANNTGWGSAQNWSNGQSQYYAGHQLHSGSGFELPSKGHILVEIGPNMQTTHKETNLNMASALSAGAPPSSFPNTSYPTTASPELFFSSLQNPSEQAFPSEYSSATSLTNTLFYPHTYPLSQSSTSAPSPSLPSATPEANPEETPDNIPGLYQKIGSGLWKCTFGECTKITHYRRDRTRHIGKHAKWEDRQIAAGLLRPEDAIAIPWRKVMIYECNIPNCGYFLETGNRFIVEDYRIDRRKGLHIEKYHSCGKNVCGKDGEEKVKRRRKNGGRIALRR
ncbi:hypothetical protein Clacol_002102 [Clathrus columnatus]|uniref:C2H2-type domain-containing protein n=1 Tax=Clathrus columnatus TaxID=1419009 RepID=A0AAV5A5M7_9AGAM|nr:hypothetical protein Clacol_002102 [Clathrus columnatus]